MKRKPRKTKCGPSMIEDDVIARLREHINAIAEMCNERIKPWEPDAGPRAVRLFNELAKPYVDYMCEYIATRPKFEFPVPWCNSLEDLVPVGETDDYLD